MKELLQNKVASTIALIFVCGYVGIYMLCDVKAIPMENIHSIVMLIIGYYFGNSEPKEKSKD